MTLAQMRLFLREGEEIKRKALARHARMTRAAMWSEGDDFSKMMAHLED